MPFQNMLVEEGFQSIEQNFEGACGYSFRAHDSVLHRDVFIKFYETCEEANESILSEPRKIASLFSEVKDAALHIASVYSASVRECNGAKYIEIVTEYCEGESLYKKLKNQTLFTYEALEIGKQIIDGLHVLHQKNFVHRDIKPSNLVISKGKIKIIDLGGATEIPQGQVQIVSRSKHSIFYRPPEAFDPNNIYGKCSDIYQVGLVVYEMINGPINENADYYIVDKIRKQ
jgi:serine/threonine protein kinase